MQCDQFVYGIQALHLDRTSWPAATSLQLIKKSLSNGVPTYALGFPQIVDQTPSSSSLSMIRRHMNGKRSLDLEDLHLGMQ
ncbi:hypothetical protein GOP47_0010186 [Adiantum capillus-veneris]|uniref:Uncharacterized protein n=1 Tax=Adiantum capillus-veneris TaxID=13818 RepID=A0A9D4UUV6_ADICA|nr:hypothetical protein GOP47_0010186 [Adiantum capillus-veneris]